MGMRGNYELGLTDVLREGVENFTAPNRLLLSRS